MSKVKSYRTEEEVKVELESGKSLVGTVDHTDDKVKIIQDNSKEASDITDQEIRMLWLKGDVAPNYVPPFYRIWETTIAASFQQETGNTDEIEYNLSLESILTRKNDTTKAFIRYENTKTGDTLTDDEIVAGLDYEYRRDNKNSDYGRMDLERDPFDDINFRFQLAMGYGRYLLDRDRMTFRTRFGVFYRHESYSSSREATDTYGPDIGFRFEYTSPHDWLWYSDVSYTPSIEDLKDCLIYHESALVAPIAETMWSIKVGLRHEYNSDSSDGKEDLDTTYFTNLQLKF
jgi:putative salt-induced outer membrane protein YdiY/small nuclear ribonucleoprotein (snRNP)-like protein